MSTLLVSLGTSPAIVPEAFLLPGVSFQAVHVLTTERTSVKLVEDWFGQNAPGVALTITRVEGFADFLSEQEHFRFEEVLYRWWLEKTEGIEPYVCLSGGFKTMSAAVQKAAAVLGAAEVFHVLADSVYDTPEGKTRPASTVSEISECRTNGHLHWIRLGGESGWPQFHGVRAGAYPLQVKQAEGKVQSVASPDHRFRDRVREVVERSHRIAGAWEQLGELPFPALATWLTADLAWLREPVDPDGDLDWLAALPKVELHCHLGGFATHGTDLLTVREAAEHPSRLPPLEIPLRPPDWPRPRHPLPLTNYMVLGNASGSALLRDRGCLRKQCALLYAHLRSQNVVYAEIRCSPANYAVSGRSPWTVINDIKAAFDEHMTSDPGCHVNLIIIATRKEKGDFRAAISRHLALAVSAAEHWTGESECRVVGVDLAGYEDRETRAHYFREEFTAIHRCGLALTVHAGENDDAEGIWRAVFDLNARRLGHALHLIDSPELLRSVADRGIGVEMCPFANYQIKGFVPMPGSSRPHYPLKTYLDAGVRVTVNTDNIGISAASLTENFVLAATLCPSLTRMDVLRLLRNATDAAFLPPIQRAALQQQMESAICRR